MNVKVPIVCLNCGNRGQRAVNKISAKTRCKRCKSHRIELDLGEKTASDGLWVKTEDGSGVNRVGETWMIDLGNVNVVVVLNAPGQGASWTINSVEDGRVATGTEPSLIDAQERAEKEAYAYYPEGFTDSFRPSAHKQAVDLTNVGIDGDDGVGTDPSGKRIKFKLSPEDRKQLSDVLLGDLSVNFSGVSVDEGDIILESSKIAEAQVCSGCGQSISLNAMPGTSLRNWIDSISGTVCLTGDRRGQMHRPAKESAKHAKFTGPGYYVLSRFEGDIISESVRHHAASESDGLDRFEQWMVQSNIDHMEEYGGAEAVIQGLRARGYDRVADGVASAIGMTARRHMAVKVYRCAKCGGKYEAKSGPESEQRCPKCGSDIKHLDGYTSSRTAGFTGPGYYVLSRFGAQPTAGPFPTASEAHAALADKRTSLGGGVQYLDAAQGSGRGDAEKFWFPEGYIPTTTYPRVPPSISRRKQAARVKCHYCDGDLEKVEGEWEHVDAGEAANCANIRGDEPIAPVESKLSKLEEIQQAVLRTNPGMDPRAARHVAVATLGKMAINDADYQTMELNQAGNDLARGICPACGEKLREASGNETLREPIKVCDNCGWRDDGGHLSARKVANWTIGHNMPGYLPMEDEPYVTSDWESARSALIDDLDRAADSMAEIVEEGAAGDALLEPFNEVIAEVRALSPGSEWSGNVPTSDSEHDLGESWYLTQTDEEAVDEVGGY